MLHQQTRPWRVLTDANEILNVSDCKHRRCLHIRYEHHYVCCEPLHTLPEHFIPIVEAPPLGFRFERSAAKDLDDFFAAVGIVVGIETLDRAETRLREKISRSHFGKSLCSPAHVFQRFRDFSLHDELLSISRTLCGKYFLLENFQSLTSESYLNLKQKSNFLRAAKAAY